VGERGKKKKKGGERKAVLVWHLFFRKGGKGTRGGGKGVKERRRGREPAPWCLAE